MVAVFTTGLRRRHAPARLACRLSQQLQKAVAMIPIDAGARAPTHDALHCRPPAPVRPELTAPQKQALAERYAPVLYFHPDERHFLQDPDVYLRESSLRQERDFRPDKQLYAEGQVPPAELARIGPGNENADGQKFLDHADSDAARAGNLDASKNLYFYDAQSNSVTYYFFYAWNDGPPGLGDVQNHEGDWERVTVQLDDQYQPVEVRYGAHNGLDVARPWSQAPTEDGRPVVYVGQGSHASYPEPGRWTTNAPGVHDRASREGLRFDMAARPAVDVTTQPWYGSHVLWGERGSAQEFGVGDTSGPTGPSPDKGEVSPDADPSRRPLAPAKPLPWWPGGAGWPF